MTKEIIFKYSKIVVFDEDSALDMLDQNNGGRLEYFEKISQSKSFDLIGKVFKESKVEKDFNLALKVVSKLGIENQITKQITNTIKTDFIRDIENKINDYSLEYIQNYKLNILEGTSTYLKTISPLTNLIKDFSQFQHIDNIDNINFSNLEEFIDDMKTYHEFLAYKGSSFKIIRVNTKHLKNDYKLSDLRNMNLNIVGVKIGQTTINNIKFDYLLESDEESINFNENSLEKSVDALSKENIPNVEKNEIQNENTKNWEFPNLNQNKKIDIIDVIVAGVK